jgi:hypothetical protein
MAYTNDPGTQANGAAGSQTQPSITNATVQQNSTGANPAMAAAEKAAQSYKQRETAMQQRSQRMADAGAVGPSYQTKEQLANAGMTGMPQPQEAAGGTNAWGATVPRPGEDAFPGGPPAPVAGGGWEGKNYQTPYGPSSDEWLNKMQGDVRASGAQTMTDQMRALQAHMASRPGMLNSGASAAATADLYRRGGMEMQGQLSQAMLGQYGDERNRLAQAWGKEGDWAMGRDTARMQADAAAAAASANAGASSAAAELQYKLGMAGLDWDREQGYMQNELDQGRLDFGYAGLDAEMFQNFYNQLGGMNTNFDPIGGGPGWQAPPPVAPPPSGG